MIICICHNVSETKIRDAVDRGQTTMPALRESLGVGTCCGKCHSCAKQVLRECLEEGAREGQPMVFQAALAA
jgi:bacterioferritin-associated ferredoxin